MTAPCASDRCDGSGFVVTHDFTGLSVNVCPDCLDVSPLPESVEARLRVVMADELVSARKVADALADFYRYGGGW